MRYLVILLPILGVLALACGGGGEGRATPTSTALPATSTPSPPAATATAEVSIPTPGEVTLPIEAAPGAIARVTYAPGEEIQAIRPDPTGFGPPDGAVFFMDTATGEIEGWYVADGDFDRSSRGVRGDNRFVTCSSGTAENTTEYLFDRDSGDVYRWNADEISILATWPSGLVFEGADPSGAERTRHFTVTDVALQTRSTFDLPSTTNRSVPDSIFQTPRVVLPDESGLALLVDRSLYLVDFASGSSRLIYEIPETLLLTSIQASPGAEGFSVTLSRLTQKNEDPVAIQAPVVRRYSREGELISEGPPDRGGGLLSPDGRLVAWGGSLHAEPVLDPGDPLHWPVVVVAEAVTGEPRFRVKGAALCYGDDLSQSGRRWLADSSGILVATKSGFRILDVAELALRPAPLSGVGQYFPFFEPSPDDPDLFAVGSHEFVGEGEGGRLSGVLTLVDAQGNSRREVVLAPSAGGLGHLSPWGSSGSEVQFDIPHPDHHARGGCGVGVTPPAKIEFPPFDDDIRLKVAADGDLDLLDLSGTTATLITRLPDGTFLTATEVESPDVAGTYMITLSLFGGALAHVRTDAGQEGWVSSKFLDWAE